MLRTRALLPHFFNCGLRIADCRFLEACLSSVAPQTSGAEERINKQHGFRLSLNPQSEIRIPQSSHRCAARRSCMNCAKAMETAVRRRMCMNPSFPKTNLHTSHATKNPAEANQTYKLLPLR